MSRLDRRKLGLDRLVGEARLKRWLCKELKRLRAENDAQYPKRYDMDITLSCQGYEAALDDIEELLLMRRRA